MPLSLQGLAATLQTLLTETAEEAARDSGFIRRRRRITGPGFVQALVLGWLADPDAKLEDLAASQGITPQSLHERFNPKAVDCLRRLLRRAIDCLVAGRPETIPLLRRFPEVCLEDSTTVGLPAGLADEYPGCGGSDPQAGRAGLKILAQLEAITGRVRIVEPAAAVASDRTLHTGLPGLPPGSLRLVDLGFFDLTRMKKETDAQIFWISRVPARLKIRAGVDPGEDISGWLKRQGSDRIDRLVTLGGKESLTCRIVAIRTPKAIAEQRLGRLRKKLVKKGRKLSEARRRLCEWTVMITNLLDADRFSAEELWVLYRVRWQVELLFKRWRSEGGLSRSRGRTSHRILCEVLAKLIGALIKHWGTLLRGGPLNAISATRAGSRVRWWSGRLREALGSGDLAAVVGLLGRLKADLDRLPRRPRRKRRTTRQSLFAPSFAA